MDPLPPTGLANAVTGFSTIGAGVVNLVLCRTVRRQPGRWLFAWGCLFLTGLPTVGYHGFGGSWLRVADVGSNLLLAWALQLAVLGDFHRPRVRTRVALASGVVNLAAIGGLVAEEAAGSRPLPLDLGAFGGFHAGELVLILDSFLVAALLFAHRRRIAPRAKPLLYAVTATFLLGLGLASAAGETLHARILAYHALWHVVGGYGFVLFWAFNHVRFAEEAFSPTQASTRSHQASSHSARASGSRGSSA